MESFAMRRLLAAVAIACAIGGILLASSALPMLAADTPVNEAFSDRDAEPADSLSEDTDEQIDALDQRERFDTERTPDRDVESPSVEDEVTEPPSDVLEEGTQTDSNEPFDASESATDSALFGVANLFASSIGVDGAIEDGLDGMVTDETSVDSDAMESQDVEDDTETELESPTDDLHTDETAGDGYDRVSESDTDRADSLIADGADGVEFDDAEEGDVEGEDVQDVGSDADVDADADEATDGDVDADGDLGAETGDSDGIDTGDEDTAGDTETEHESQTVDYSSDSGESDRSSGEVGVGTDTEDDTDAEYTGETADTGVADDSSNDSDEANVESNDSDEANVESNDSDEAGTESNDSDLAGADVDTGGESPTFPQLSTGAVGAALIGIGLVLGLFVISRLDDPKGTLRAIPSRVLTAVLGGIVALSHRFERVIDTIRHRYSIAGLSSRVVTSLQSLYHSTRSHLATLWSRLPLTNRRGRAHSDVEQTTFDPNNGRGAESNSTAGRGHRHLSARDRIRIAFEHVVETAAIGPRRFVTPGEVSRRAKAAGAPAEPIETITESFRAVEYGGIDPKPLVDSTERANERLRASGTRESDRSIPGESSNRRSTRASVETATQSAGTTGETTITEPGTERESNSGFAGTLADVPVPPVDSEDSPEPPVDSEDSPEPPVDSEDDPESPEDGIDSDLADETDTARTTDSAGDSETGQ